MKKEVAEWIKTIALSLIIALIITTFIKPTIVRHSSMNPTLKQNDFLIINRFLYKRGTPERGDIIVFKTDLKTDEGKEKLLIKRVIAVPDDRIVIKKGRVFINGERLVEDYIADEYTAGNIDITIPKDKVFVMGDNRSYSLDSRDDVLGLVDFNSIIGKASIRLFPFNKIGRLK